MQEFIASFGLFAPIIYVLVVAFGPIAFLPMSFLSMIGGVLFGLKLGLALNILGIALNCLIMFIMTRHLFKSYVQKVIDKKIPQDKKDMIFNIDDNKLMISMLILRFIPVFPYSIINYAFAMTNISFKKYMFAGVLGAIPGKIIYLNVGSTSTDIWSKEFLIAALLLLLMTIGSIYASKKYNKKK
ncbi:MAG: VTT domain-containing protein [Gemella sp.]|nr:VTT domain-containing protein [Gemella sp.]